MQISKEKTAVVITDPQNDFLSPNGVTWGLVGSSVKQNQTVEHIDALFQAAKTFGYDVFISPHYYYQHPELGDGYATALTNFGFLASAVLTTAEVVAKMQLFRRGP